MRRVSLFICIFAVSFIFARPVWADSSYVVQPGDNLTKIAARFQVSVEALIQANHLSNPNSIRIGQTLIIPDGAPAPVAPTTASTYTVQPGDSVSRVAARFHISMDDLISANNLRTTTLQIGQVLIIPGAAPAPPDSVYNRIRGSQAFTQRIKAALDWLQAHDGEAYNRINTYVTLISPSPYRSLARAIPLPGGCSVQALARAYQSTEMVAAILYHEASHCYQFATSGIPEANKAAEVFAYQEQIAFMERNNFPPEELDYYRKVLEYYASQPDDGRFIPPPDF